MARSGKVLNKNHLIKDDEEDDITHPRVVDPPKVDVPTVDPNVIKKMQQAHSSPLDVIDIPSNENKINNDVPFMEALEKILGYAKFIKDLVTKKKNINFEIVKVTHQCSAIISQTGVKKMEDPRAFIIPCTSSVTSFAKIFCDLGACINLMPYDVFKRLGLGDPSPTTVKLLMADRPLKKLLGVIDDILIKLGRFYFPADFVILDCKVDREVHIILVRPFLATGARHL
ncbi:uncharacterized protein [Nicotiana tomentosiformis]|uniref:uncharacterized protein n=1 Tax=Nicotiana tomentosiformis TaxID=4098 RepID=UPI00388C66BF